MSGPTRKQQLQAKKKALRAKMERRRALARKKLAGRTGTLADKRRAKRRRRILFLFAVILLILALLQNCCCVGAVIPEPEVIEEVDPEEEVEVEGLGTPIGRIKPRQRPAYRKEKPTPLPWLALFRMQVAARGPRLSKCFIGSGGPGTLRWTTTVEPVKGRVSEHQLEPMLLSIDLSREERTCVLNVLSDPPYKLNVSSGEDNSMASRVGMVIEF